MATYSYEGEEYEFVNTPEELLEELKCPICLELVSNPVQTSCGHLFCGKCITRTGTCPIDRKEYTSHTDNYNGRRTRNFTVKCPNKVRGCQWEGDLGNIAKHIDVNCDYQIMVCDHAGCGVKVRRGLMVNHTRMCPQRMYKCPHCCKEDTYLTVTTTHFTTCGDMPLTCPGGCGRRGLVRRNMAQHLLECPEELVACTFAIAGCQQILKRKGLQQHLQYRGQHLDTVLSSYVYLIVLLRDLVTADNSGNRQRVEVTQLPFFFHTWLQNTPTCYPRLPWVIKMEGFREKKKINWQWFSDPVYSHFGGYKMCLRVYSNGIMDAKGTHVSVFICLMRGDNDDNLKWPFKGTIRLSLLNQLGDRQHHTEELCSPDDHITEGERADRGGGLAKFISQQDLDYQGDTNCQYLKDNTLFFRVDCIDPNLD